MRRMFERRSKEPAAGAGVYRQWAGRLGCAALLGIVLGCVVLLPWAIAPIAAPDGSGHVARRFEAQNVEAALLPPWWAWHAEDERLVRGELEHVLQYPLGSDRLGRDVLARCIVGGVFSLGIGIAAALVAVLIGTSYGTIAGYVGGKTDAWMMRIVDVLYGLPNILLVVLFTIAMDGIVERLGAEPSPLFRQTVNVLTLLFAIGGVIWLTMARVVRGQVLSLKAQPFMEACRAMGIPIRRQFLVHLTPNLLGPVIVYATLTVPTAILSESFLSFLGIGVREPLPSWGNLASSGLNELNIVRTRWWLLLWPCLLVAVSLLALNFVGEAMRERFDPRRQGARA